MGMYICNDCQRAHPKLHLDFLAQCHANCEICGYLHDIWKEEFCTFTWDLERCFTTDPKGHLQKQLDEIEAGPGIWICGAMEKLLEQFLYGMAALTPEERLEVFDKIKCKYCPHCGRLQPEESDVLCQCWNDE